jgi:hypothetical protein
MCAWEPAMRSFYTLTVTALLDTVGKSDEDASTRIGGFDGMR